MKPKLFNFTVVIVGQVHNPSILNPDFLRAQNIVPEEWGWKVAETVTTPPFSLVKYENGMSITAELNKIQVADTNPEAPPDENSRTAQIAASYISTLPHVRYTAVGTNFHSFIETSEPEDYLKKRFLKAGDWDRERHPLHAAGLRLVYRLPDDGRVVLSIDAGEITEKDESSGKVTVLANGNFHRQCKEPPGRDDVEHHLQQVPSDWEMYQMLLCDALGTQEE